MRKLTSKYETKNFILEAKKVHGDKYDYSKVNCNGSIEKVCIICPEHGEFWQRPSDHLRGFGCKKCKEETLSKKQAQTKDVFIDKARSVHGDKYDYSKVIYKNNRTKVCIICPEHGEFWQTPSNHLNGQKCPKCAKQKGNANYLTTFIELANKKHNKKYDYSKTEYVNNKTKVLITCPIHGEFWQRPNDHLNGCGCPICGIEGRIEKRTKSKNDFIHEAKLVHGDKYDYSKVDYKNLNTRICIICPKHGEFWQTPSNHLAKHGCPKCAFDDNALKKKKTLEGFISEAKLVHGEKYDYSKVEYVNNRTAICIICPEHGEFWQRPNDHLNGQGCPKCNSSHLENEIRSIIKSKSLIFEEQKKFEWLGRQSLDFYIPSKNIAIECQGEQHFISKNFFGGDDGLNEIISRDKRKKILCEEHGVKLLYYSNLKIEYPYEVFEDKEKLLEEIKETQVGL